MAYASTPTTSRFDLVAQLRAYGADAVQAWVKYRDFRSTYSQLMELSDRELNDLGLSRHNLREVAHETAYGK